MKMLVWPAERKITFTPTSHPPPPACICSCQRAPVKYRRTDFTALLWDTATDAVDFWRIKSVPVRVFLNPGQCVSNALPVKLSTEVLASCFRHRGAAFKSFSAIFNVYPWLAVPCNRVVNSTDLTKAMYCISILDFYWNKLTNPSWQTLERCAMHSDIVTKPLRWALAQYSTFKHLPQWHCFTTTRTVQKYECLFLTPTQPCFGEFFLRKIWQL